MFLQLSWPLKVAGLPEMAMFGITISTSKEQRLLAILWVEECKASRVGGACYLPASLEESAIIALTRAANKNTRFQGLSSHIVTRISQCDSGSNLTVLPSVVT